ncbi:hypothetical protein NBRC116493_00320 [Aurantivibrio infirmus]
MYLISKNNSTKPVVGTSACLMGEAVRYDGADKKHALLNEVLAPHLQLQSFCPEVTAGLGIPRPPVRLVGSPDNARRAIGVADSGIDVTERLLEVSTNYLQYAISSELCGFIFQSRSPSCGFQSTPIYGAKPGEPLAFGNGIFAGFIHSQLNYLICVEDTWLRDKGQCYLFLAAVILTRGQEFSGHVDPELISLITGQPSGDGETLRDGIGEGLAILLSLRELEKPLPELSSIRNEKAALCRRLSEYFEA